MSTTFNKEDMSKNSGQSTNFKTFNEQDASKISLDIERFIVITNFGNVLKPSENYKKRWWHWRHEIVWLHPKDFETIKDNARLHDGISTISFLIKIKYQPTIEYASSILEIDPTQRNIHEKIERSLKPIIESEVRLQIKKLKLEDFIPTNEQEDNDKKISELINNTEKNICESIEEIFQKNHINSHVLCSLNLPNIDWPKLKEDEEPQLIFGQGFYERLKMQHYKFIQRQREIKFDEIKNKNSHDLKEQKEENSRIINLKNENIEHLNKKKEADAKEEKLELEREQSKAEYKSKLKLIDVRIEQEEYIEKLKLEEGIREHKMSSYDNELKFIGAETTILEHEKKRLIAEEYLRKVENLVSQDLERIEIDNAERRQISENIVEILKQLEIFKVLPQLFSQLNKHTQSVEHLSVLQVNDSMGNSASLPGNPVNQLVQSLSVVKQVINFLTEHGTNTKNDVKP